MENIIFKADLKQELFKCESQVLLLREHLAYFNYSVCHSDISDIMSKMLIMLRRQKVITELQISMIKKALLQKSQNKPKYEQKEKWITEIGGLQLNLMSFVECLQEWKDYIDENFEINESEIDNRPLGPQNP
jgi:phage-related minor tail protein